MAGKGGQPTEVLLHADRLVSIRHSGLGPRPVPGSMGGSPLGGRSRGRDGQGSPQRERATAADRQQAAGGSGAAAEPGAQLVPYLARHGSNGEPEYELIGRQLLLSGLPRAWQRDELRVQALVEGTGARGACLCMINCVQGAVPFGKWHRLMGGACSFAGRVLRRRVCACSSCPLLPLPVSMAGCLKGEPCLLVGSVHSQVHSWR